MGSSRHSKKRVIPQKSDKVCSSPAKLSDTVNENSCTYQNVECKCTHANTTNDSASTSSREDEDATQFFVEYSKSGKSRCRKCRKVLEKNEIRIGKMFSLNKKEIKGTFT